MNLYALGVVVLLATVAAAVSWHQLRQAPRVRYAGRRRGWLR